MSREAREATAGARELARAVRDQCDAMMAEGFSEEAALRFIAVWFGTQNRPPEDPK